MNFIERVQKRLPDEVLFDSLQKLSKKYKINDKDIIKAKNGDAESLFKISCNCFTYGWYEGSLLTAYKLDKRNHAGAQQIIAKLFDRGHFGFKNPKNAVKWYIKAICSEESSCSKYLDNCFVTRKKKNFKELNWAFDFLLQNAAKNNKVAQFLLASFYENGFGTLVDKKLAVIWYFKSAAQKYQPAINRAMELERQGYTMILIAPGDTGIIELDSASINLQNNGEKKTEINLENDMNNTRDQLETLKRENAELKDKVIQLEIKINSIKLTNSNSIELLNVGRRKKNKKLISLAEI